tara:strand:- start:53 stop:532 length:480 start_codon:yes stop_codon:yes gene_type:complete
MAHQLWHKEYPGLLNMGFGGQGGNPNYRGVREPDYFDPETIRREAPMSAPAGYVPMDERAIGPQLAPMESGVSPRQSGFTGSVEWDVMNGNLEDPLGGPDMGQDPSNVGDVVGAGLSGAGQYVSNIFKPPELDKWANLQSNNLGFPDRRKRRQTWMGLA